MLTENQIDKLMQSIRGDGNSYVYYIAHRVECREGYIDELVYKSVPKFRVLKLKVRNIINAYFELLKFKNYPGNYHTESEETYLEDGSKYVYYYTVPNGSDHYTKDLNPRIPSAIYGVRRILWREGKVVGDYSDPSPIKEVYKNNLSYGDYKPNKVLTELNAGRLAWKYLKLDEPLLVDAIKFNYVTSDWYILDIENFPRTEMHLVNTKQKTAFFMTNEEAQSYVKQLEA